MLNESQRAAVERWGQDVCVVAGPGSGKTRVLIERFRWLVEEKQISPRRILAVTFTEKAATEIKKRLIDTFTASAGFREEIERAWVSTIHGFCTRLLKENAIAAGIDPEFRLLDEAESQIALRRFADQALDGLLREETELMRVLLYEIDSGASDVADGIIGLYEELRSAGVPLGDLRVPRAAEDDPWDAVLSAARVLLTDPPNGTYKQRESHIKLHQWARECLQMRGRWQQRVALLESMPKPNSLKIGTRARSVAQELRDSTIPAIEGEIVLGVREPLYPIVLEALRRMHRDYAAYKRSNGCLDFDDLQEQAIHLLENNAELRQRVAANFDQILMDELQDTNRLQWRLVDLIRRPGSLFAVGDINQSIYYFRHADPSVFRDYRDSLAERGEAVDELRENYRSRPEVLDVMNAVTPYLMGGVEPHRLSARRECGSKAAPSVEFVQTFAARPESEPAQTEARWIARRIRELAPARYSEVAILARTIASLAVIQEVLDEFGIPSVVSGGRGFFEAREVRDLNALLAVLANPQDEISLALVLRSPLVGLSDETLLRLRANQEDLAAALETLVVEGTPDAERLAWFRGMIAEQRRRMDDLPPDQLLLRFLDESGYQEGLAARARANIAKFLSLLRHRHGRTPVPLAQLVEDLVARRHTHSEPEAAAAEITNSVRLMSIHAAKGLEFPIVFIAAMRNGGQNRKPIFCFDAERVLGTSWRHPAPAPGQAKGISDSIHLRVLADRKRQESGEEDRLLYVAMTRAEEHLIFTASPSGQGEWVRRISDALGQPGGTPKQEHTETVYLLNGSAVRIVHTSEAAGSEYAPVQENAAPDAVEDVDPPATPDLYETALPVTSVAQHAFCPRQYYLARYLRWPAAAREKLRIEPKTEDGEFSASEFGQLVHSMLSGDPAEAPPEEALAMVEGFAASELGRRAARAQRIGREFDFLVELEGVILRGQIDLWFEENGEAVLVDYKSDAVEEGRELMHALRYGPQLRLYALALEKHLERRPERAYLWYLRTRRAVTVSLANEQLERAREQVRSLRTAQSTLEFPLREGAHCLRCAYYRNACPSAFVEL